MVEGKVSRDFRYGPARQWNGGINNGGSEGFYVNGVLHRVSGPALQKDGGICVGGSEEWRLNGQKHRTDGPAVQYNGGIFRCGEEEWWFKGNKHRNPHDGPAVTCAIKSGGFDSQWWIDGSRFDSQDEALTYWKERYENRVFPRI